LVTIAMELKAERPSDPTAARVAAAMTTRLDDEDRDVRYAAAAALGFVGPPDRSCIGTLLDSVRAKRGTGSAGTEAIARFGADSVPALIMLLDDPRPSVRRAA